MKVTLIIFIISIGCLNVAFSQFELDTSNQEYFKELIEELWLGELRSEEVKSEINIFHLKNEYDQLKELTSNFSYNVKDHFYKPEVFSLDGHYLAKIDMKVWLKKNLIYFYRLKIFSDPIYLSGYNNNNELLGHALRPVVNQIVSSVVDIDKIVNKTSGVSYEITDNNFIGLKTNLNELMKMVEELKSIRVERSTSKAKEAIDLIVKNESFIKNLWKDLSNFINI